MPALVQIGGKRSGARSRRPGVEAFLPTNLAEARARGWDQLDVVLVNGDAYVDHPTFGVPLLGRVLAARGFKVGILSQPRWDMGTATVGCAERKSAPNSTARGGEAPSAVSVVRTPCAPCGSSRRTQPNARWSSHCRHATKRSAHD